MAKDQAGAPTAPRGKGSSGGGRGPQPPARPVAAATAAAPKKRTNPAQFFREVRAEARKITWTSRKETWITSVMVFIMVALATVFFWGLDAILALSISRLVQLGG